MSTDNLDSLSDSALSEVFAVEIGGWNKIERVPRHPRFASVLWRKAGVLGANRRSAPSFATDANAVLPFLEPLEYVVGHEPNAAHRVQLWVDGVWMADGSAPTLAKAAAIALIRATRAQKGGAK